MKNIHILPTNQPSRLAIQLDCKPKYNLQLSKIESDWTHNWEKQHIYIISSEEIEEGVNQWYLDKFLNKPMNSGGAQYGEKQNIIILTTDPTLIADGVQAIYDEFLEWFVKNPTCEFVEVKHKDIIQYGNMTMKDFNGDGSYYVCTDCGDLEVSRSKQEVLKFGVEYYKIIIPQEEPKPDKVKNIERMIKHHEERINDIKKYVDKVKKDSNTKIKFIENWIKKLKDELD